MAHETRDPRSAKRRGVLRAAVGLLILGLFVAGLSLLWVDPVTPGTATPTCLACRDSLLGLLASVLGAFVSLAAWIAAQAQRGFDWVSRPVDQGLGRADDYSGGRLSGFFSQFFGGINAIFGGIGSVAQGLFALAGQAPNAANKGFEAVASWAQQALDVGVQGAKWTAGTAGSTGSAAVEALDQVLSILFPGAD